DPRLGFVTITDVRVTGDLQQASIFYTVLGDDEARLNTAKVLESAKGLLRTEVGRELGTRITPSLTFFADALGDSAKNFEDLLDQVRKSDEEIANLRSGAEPISGDDPYRQSRPKNYLSGE
ncbi:MAG: 30S ribosome-binding factor RbfA, partial [Actinobacteria bacterium]|nr:30S ribosome-binding factor RbfA [Actinomycetota bacterium]